MATQFTAEMWCKKCKRIRPHRVFFLHFYGEVCGGFVHIGHLCIHIISQTGRGATRRTETCNHYREDMLALKDYNALVRLAKEDHECDFHTNDEEVEDET